MQKLKELKSPAPEPPDKQVACKMWEHTEDIAIVRPKKAPSWTLESNNKSMHLFFDGGCNPKHK